MDRATGWLTRRWLRRRWIAMVPLALIVAAGTAGAALALAAAHRTSDAYREYLRRADVGDVVINPSINSREIDDLIRTMPNVEQVTSDSMFNVTNDEGAPRTLQAVDESGGPYVIVRGSSDGRYTAMDRPVVQAGRMPTGPSEAVLTVEAAEATGVSIGDVVPLSFWPAGAAELPGDAYANEAISPIGVEHVRVVGFVTLPNEVLPDSLYPRATAIVSPDIATRYDCLPVTPPPGGTLAELAAALLPPDCSVNYRYYSLSMTGGAADVKPALDQFVRESALMTERLRTLSDAADHDPDTLPAYFLIPAETDAQVRSVERSIRPTIAAFVVLGLSLAAVTVALAGLAAARELRRTAPDQQQWYQLGVGTASRAAVMAVPPLAATAIGLLAGVGAARLLDIGPVGLVQVIEPHPQGRFDGVALLAAAAIGFVTAATIGVLAHRTSRRLAAAQANARRRASRGLPLRIGSPAVSGGVRAALAARSAPPVLAGGTLLTGVFVASAVFGLSLSSLLSTPRAYGWPWDVAAMTGAGYGDLDLDAAQAAFDDDPAVASWTVLGFSSQIALNGQPMTAMVGFDQTAGVELTVRSGALPVAADEVAVGERTAADLGVHVGDSVEVGEGDAPTQQATVSGIVVFPSVGPLLSDRVGTGTGLLLPEAMLNAAAERRLTTQTVRDMATFVGIDLADGADTPEVRERLLAVLTRLDTLGVPPFVYGQPIRPPEIIDAGATRRVPIGVGIAFAATATIGLVFVSWASVRSRRRELAVLRSLGFDDSQVRRTVQVHALATMATALLIGVPLGVIAGRTLWRAFASQLGVLTDPPDLWAAVGLTVAGGLALAVVAAQVPARLAARATPAAGLRAE